VYEDGSFHILPPHPGASAVALPPLGGDAVLMPKALLCSCRRESSDLAKGTPVQYGYARVSTDDQNPALQLAALKKAGCTTIFKDEGLSGATTKRPALTRCLNTLRAGDTLMVWKLDRLGRSLRDLITMLDALRAQWIKFRSLTEHIDTETPAGRAMWQMIGVLAELERSLITERTRAGVQAAKARGVKFGRKPKLTPKQRKHARDLRTQGMRVEDIADLLPVSRSTLYRLLAE
jgi:DNA invertase Pin-like site-specific DNA recombinase